MPLIWVQKKLWGGRVISLSGLPGGFNLDNYEVKKALCISPSLSQSHLWPPRWQQSPARSSLLNHHFSDSLSYQQRMECLQTGSLTRCHKCSKEAPWDTLPDATGPGWAPSVYVGKAGKFHKMLLVSEGTVASNCMYTYTWKKTHIYCTCPAIFTQTDPADMQLKKFHTCCQNFLSN